MRPSLVFLVFVGGGIGSVARYLLATTVQRNAPGGFPFGTFLVNMIGCFAIGLVGALGLERAALTPDARAFLMAGVLGGFTTFSALTWETLVLLSARDVLRATLYVGGSVGLGLLGTVLGRAIGRIGA
jgi:fluoride exporter